MENMKKYRLEFVARAKAMGIKNPTWLRRLAGIAPSTAHALWNQTGEYQLHLDVFSRLCKLLACTPGTIIVPEDQADSEPPPVRRRYSREDSKAVKPLIYDRYSVNIQHLAGVRGIRNAHHLWQKMGGSLETSYKIWSGEAKIITLDSVSKLCHILRCSPDRIFKVGEKD